MSAATLTLKPTKEKSLKRGHPWVFSGAVARIEGEQASGATVRIVDAQGRFLAWGALSPQSQIRARVWSFQHNTVIDAAFFQRRVAVAVALRKRHAFASNAMRLVHAEADGLPGLVVDRYADTMVTQFGAAGVEAWRAEICAALLEESGCARLFDRSDADVRTLEGLAPRVGWQHGAGDFVVPIEEHGLRYQVDVAQGHKTGWYLDQRDNRAAVYEAVKSRKLQRVLNCFSYTGGFSLAALRGGAQQVVSVDSSSPALTIAQSEAAKNGYGIGSSASTANLAWHEADVFAYLRDARQRQEHYDCIILDPPKFAPTPATIERAARAYKDINLCALRLLEPGGLLFTFSCSGGVSADLFQKIVAGAAVDAGVECRIVGRLGAPLDHPLSLAFPEGEYLKGLVLERV